MTEAEVLHERYNLILTMREVLESNDKILKLLDTVIKKLQ